MWKKIIGWLKSGSMGSAQPAIENPGLGTEFTAEVVRVTRVLPHPNADRLEITRFEMAGTPGECGYEVVTQLGTSKPGDVMTYLSVDCVVPTSHPEFQFLMKRLDGAGKTHYRLRAARLRGVFSAGLLVPAPSDAKFGQDIAETFGVTYHNPDIGESIELTLGAPKSKSKWKRQPAPQYKVDSLKKAPRLFTEGERVLATEKIHGTNFRFGWVARRRFMGIALGHRFFIGSHHAVKGIDTGGYHGGDIWAEAAARMHLAAKTKRWKGHVFYGELYGHDYNGKVIQPGYGYNTNPKTGPRLAVFDVYDVARKEWLQPYDRMDVLDDCDLSGPPVVMHGPFDVTKIKAAAEDQSSWQGMIREGVVVETIGVPRKKAKYVSEQYLMRKE